MSLFGNKKKVEETQLRIQKIKKEEYCNKEFIYLWGEEDYRPDETFFTEINALENQGYMLVSILFHDFRVHAILRRKR